LLSDGLTPVTLNAAQTAQQTLIRDWPWPVCLAVAVALPVAIPMLAIAYLALGADSSAWQSGLATSLPSLFFNTLLLCIGASCVSLLLGVGCAWLISFFQFPLRKSLAWMAFLPIAMPGYIVSFVYVDFLAYAGPLQSWLRGHMGWASPQDYSFPEIRSLGGAAIVMGLVLYPYVYLAARAAFARQPVNQILAARTLGHSLFRVFIKVILPQARPALAVGLALVVMECLNDIGAMSFFGVRTFAIAIFSTWLDMGNLGGAAQMALFMLMVVIALVAFERWARSRDGLPRVQHVSNRIPREPLSNLKGWLAAAAVFVPVFFGFLLPVLLLLGHGYRRIDSTFTATLLHWATNSVLLALLAAAAAISLALIIGYAQRQGGSRVLTATSFLATLGYAIPGTVLAIGIIVPFSALDHLVHGLSLSVFGTGTGLLLSGTLFALLFAYVARFLIIATGMTEAGMERIPRNMDHAARTLGHGPLETFVKIHLPLLRPALMAGALLVFVDAMKELPATLLLRPFNFETLATSVFTSASLGLVEEAALPALAIVASGLLPVIVLMRGFRQGREPNRASP
jgi:iron(III) transport system permease protein